MHVEDVGDLFGLDVEDEDVDTVGGLLAKALGRGPIAGARGTIAGLDLTADRFEGRRKQLATVIVRRAPERSGSADPKEAGA
jgi:Mg2+/Co2+ transporter CorC